MLPGTYNPPSQTSNPRSFTLSVAVAGKTSWNLDTDGPLTITTAYSGTLTPGPGFAATVQLWGPGGSSGATTGTPTPAGAGTNSQFGSMNAGAGGISASTATSGTATTPGTGGTASGGNVSNTNGNSGSSGTAGSSGGNGAAAPSGGAAAVAPTGVGSNSMADGVAGNGPGGGAAGGAVNRSGASFSVGGGGSGALVVSTFTAGQLSGAQTLVVGDSGAAGIAGTGTYKCNGAKGATGKIIIT